MRNDAGRILVVDPDSACRKTLSTLLRRVGFATSGAEGIAEGLAAARGERPSLVLLEVQLSDGSGYELCRELRDEFGEALPIIFLSGEREPFERAAGLLIGADDYIVKPFNADELMARVRRAVTRSVALQGDVMVAEQWARSALTEREREVLALLADGVGPKGIAVELFLSPKTVATHIQHILEKLGVHSRTEAVALAYRERLVKT